MRAILLLTLAGMVVVTSPAAADGGHFGAIAYDPEADKVYVVTDAATRDDAVSKAMANCQDDAGTSCRVPLWFQAACGALSRSSNGAWGTGWGVNSSVATSWAAKICEGVGGQDCKLKVVVCGAAPASNETPTGAPVS